MEHNDVVIIVPCYNPDEKYIQFLADLKENGYNNIISVNDGSKRETEEFFRIAEGEDVKILNHSINLGQGRAYKTAFNFYLYETKMGGVLRIRLVLFNAIVMDNTILMI